MAKKAASPAAELLAYAQEKASQVKTWEELHNAIYGLGGKFSQLFPSQQERTAFAQREEYREISKLISSVAGGESLPGGTATASGKFVLRLPESMHAALVAEAEREGVSLNTLCIAKLAVQLRSSVQ